MKIHYALVLCCLFAAASPLTSHGEGTFHTFTTPDGRSLNAVIKDYNGSNGKIQIEREDGKKLWILPTVFSEPDQEYIRQWIIADQFMSSTKFKITGKKTKKEIPMYDAHSVSGTSYVTHESRIEIEYEITLENKTDFPLKNLKIEYRAFIFNQGFEDKKDSSRVDGGQFQIDEILPRGKVSKKTQIINLITQFKTVVRSYYGATEISQKNINKEQLKGVWVKIYGPELDGKPAIRDWCNPSDTSEDFAWQDKTQAASKVATTSTTKKPRDTHFYSDKERALLDKARRLWESDPEQALKLGHECYEMAQAPGAAWTIGYIYYSRLKPPNVPLGLEWLEKAAEENYYPACKNLLYIYMYTQHDIEKTIKYGLKAESISNSPHVWNERDTLAEAYALDGQFDKAVEYQSLAIKLYKKTEKHSRDRLSKMKATLELYRNNKTE